VRSVDCRDRQDEGPVLDVIEARIPPDEFFVLGLDAVANPQDRAPIELVQVFGDRFGEFQIFWGSVFGVQRHSRLNVEPT
jgi:hypothetical protein